MEVGNTPDERVINNGDSPVESHHPHKMSAGEYAVTRISTLKPPMNKAPNPFKLLAMLSGKQWLFFLVGFLAWVRFLTEIHSQPLIFLQTWDAFDFFTVSLTLSDLAETFGKTNVQISWGITLVLMFRSVGSIIFGLAADRYGRKWPFVVNNVLFIVLELGTGFCQTYRQFLACRALFGIAMGGLYGNAAATALEDCPEAARGLVSGMLQQGYAFGYLLATAFSRGLVNTTSHGWRPLFWFGACPPVLIIIFRLCLPETDTFIARELVRSERGNIGKTFIAEGKVALKRHWLLLIYLVLLMAGFNFMVRLHLSPSKILLTISVPRFPRSLPYHVDQPIQLQPQRRYRHSSRSKSRRYDGRDSHRIQFPNLRAQILHHLHCHHRSRPPLPLHLHFLPCRDRRSILRTILCSRRLGRDSHPSHGTLTRLLPNFCRRYILPAW